MQFNDKVVDLSLKRINPSIGQPVWLSGFKPLERRKNRNMRKWRILSWTSPFFWDKVKFCFNFVSQNLIHILIFCWTKFNFVLDKIKSCVTKFRFVRQMYSVLNEIVYILLNKVKLNFISWDNNQLTFIRKQYHYISTSEIIIGILRLSPLSVPLWNLAVQKTNYVQLW